MSRSSDRTDSIAINDIKEYVAYISDAPNYPFFRGVSNKAYELVPSIGRNWKGELDKLIDIEKYMLQQFKLRSVLQLPNAPKNAWEFLMIGQHHGMPTRLLDWTTSPLVALYFACLGENTIDGAVYALPSAPPLDLEKYPNPFDITENFMLMPPHISPRIAAQSSRFSVSSNPIKPFEVKNKNSRVKLIIPAKRKSGILTSLILKFGIGPTSLFPGLDGLCDQIALETTINKKVELRNQTNRELVRLLSKIAKERTKSV